MSIGYDLLQKITGENKSKAQEVIERVKAPELSKVKELTYAIKNGMADIYDKEKNIIFSVKDREKIHFLGTDFTVVIEDGFFTTSCDLYHLYTGQSYSLAKNIIDGEKPKRSNQKHTLIDWKLADAHIDIVSDSSSSLSRMQQIIREMSSGATRETPTTRRRNREPF